MGGLLRDWMGLALEREISEGLDWSRESAASKAKIRNSQALEDMYHDDGSNLRFTYSPGERSAVQVFDLIAYDKKPYVDATISDGTTLVKAIFSSKYVDQFKQTHRRNLTKDIIGGVFYLETFEIVVDYAGAGAADPVLIRILEATFQGSSGSPIFGKPSWINQRSNIKTLVEKLQNSADEDMASQYGGSQSRRSSVDDNGHLEETQFATQISGSLKPKKKSSNPVPQSPFRGQPPVDPERVVLKAQELARMEADDAPTSFQAPRPDIHSSALPNSSAAAPFAPLGGVDRMGGSQLKNPSLPSSTSTAVQSSGSHARSAASQNASPKFVSSSGPWKGTLPISRAIGLVSQEQDDVLRETKSWLPPAPGKMFPLGNVPGPVLTLLSERAERPAKAQQVRANRLDVEHHNLGKNSAEGVNCEKEGAEDEENRRSPVPQSSGQMSWSLSPPEHTGNRLQDPESPPDSSGQQSSGRPATHMTVFPIPPSSAPSGVTEADRNRSGLSREQTEVAQNQDSADMRSSPPEIRQPSPVVSHRPEYNDEDDLEMSAPKPPPTSNPQLHQTPSQMSTAARMPLEEEYASEAEEADFIEQEQPARVPRNSNRNFMARHITSSSNPQPTDPDCPRLETPLRSPNILRQNEIESQASLRAKRNTKRSDDERQSLPSHERSQDATPHNDHVLQKPQGREVSNIQSPGVVLQSERSTKRAQLSPSPEESSNKRPKSFHAGREHRRSYHESKNADARSANKVPGSPSHQFGNMDAGPAVAMDAQTLGDLSLSQTESHALLPGQQQERVDKVTEDSSLKQTSTSTFSDLPKHPTPSHVPDMPRDDVFADFKVAYPEFGGNRIQFTELCRKYHDPLLRQWFRHTFRDDFIIRYFTDFRQYKSKCYEEVAEELPYPDYYFKSFYQGDEPKFNKGILSASSLKKLLKLEVRPERASQQRRGRSRSPTFEERGINYEYRRSSSEYRQRSPISNRSVNPTTGRIRSPSHRESLPARLLNSECEDGPTMVEQRRGVSAPGGPMTTYSGKSPSSSGLAGPASTTHGSPTRRESMPSRRQDSKRTPRYGGDSYRPDPRGPDEAVLQMNSPHASSSHASPDKLKQHQRETLVIRESPSKRAQQNLSPRGPASSPTSLQKAAATPRSSTSQAQRLQPSGLGAPGRSNPSVALDQTNAKPGSSVSKGLRTDDLPASASPKTEKHAPNTARRGGRGGRGRGGYSTRKHYGADGVFYAVDNPSSNTVPASTAAPDGGNDKTPIMVNTEKPSAPDNKSNRKQPPAAGGGPGRGTDTAPPVIKTAKPTAAPAAALPKKPNGRNGAAAGGEERGRSSRPHSRQGANSGRGAGGAGSNQSVRAPEPANKAPSKAPPSRTTTPTTAASKNTTLNATDVAASFNTPKAQAPARHLMPPAPPSTSASRTDKTKNPFSAYKQRCDDAKARKSSGGSGQGSPASMN
ncbi:hypothetical protein IWZ01DRAFT_227993 [Phyllosticta capitalensis]